MRKAYQLIVFDWEGTLGDTLGQAIHVLNEIVRELKLEIVEETLARQYLSYGLIVGIKKLFPHLQPGQQKMLIQKIQVGMALRAQEVYLIPGAKKLITTLAKSQVSLAIATNKSQVSLKRDLEHSGLEIYFSATRCAGQVPAKPCPQMLEELIELTGASTNSTLMIGDSVSDMEMAKTLKVDAIGVNFYYQKDQEKDLIDAGALSVFYSFEQISQFLGLQL